MFGDVVPGIVTDQHEIVAVERSGCHVFFRQQVRLPGRFDELVDGKLYFLTAWCGGAATVKNTDCAVCRFE